MTFCYKAGQGIVTAVSTSLLTAVGFVSGKAEQTPEAAAGIGWILCVGVVVFVGAGILIFSRLKLDKNKIAEILAKDTAEMNNAALVAEGAETQTESLDNEKLAISQEAAATEEDNLSE